MAVRRNVLAVGLNADEYSHVAPFLDRGAFNVDRFPGAPRAIELVQQVAVEALLVRYPLRDMPTQTFLDAVRDEKSASRRSPLVLVVGAEHAAEAERYVGRGANRVLRLDEAQEHIQDALGRLLMVAPRQAARLVVRLEVKLGQETASSLCQTSNVSATGMLVETDSKPARGTVLGFEFMLDHRPIAGTAEVVRNAHPDRDKVTGLGLRFVSFAGDSRERLQRHLERLKAPGRR